MADLPKSTSFLKPLALVFCCLLPLLAILELKSSRNQQSTLDKMSNDIDTLEKKLLEVKANVNNAAAKQQPLVIDNTALLATLSKVMLTQQQAWNRGNLNEFMQPYWNSAELSLSTGGKTTRGWKTTLEHYQKIYPTPEKMGQLSFENLEATALGVNTALVLGEWHLTLKNDNELGGNFSLVFRQLDGQWKIVHEHSSSLKAAEATDAE